VAGVTGPGATAFLLLNTRAGFEVRGPSPSPLKPAGGVPRSRVREGSWGGDGGKTETNELDDRAMIGLTLIVTAGLATLVLLRPTERQRAYAARAVWRRRPWAGRQVV
jgi:hypothetical protein